MHGSVPPPPPVGGPPPVAAPPPVAPPPPPPVPLVTQVNVLALQTSPMRPQSEHAPPPRPQKLSDVFNGEVKHWPLAQQPLAHVVGLHEVLLMQANAAGSHRWPRAPQSSQAAPPVPQKLVVVFSGAAKH